MIEVQKIYDVKHVVDYYDVMAAIFVDGVLTDCDESRNIDVGYLASSMKGKAFKLQHGRVWTEGYCHNGEGAWRWKKLSTMLKHVDIHWQE